MRDLTEAQAAEARAAEADYRAGLRAIRIRLLESRVAALEAAAPRPEELSTEQAALLELAARIAQLEVDSMSWKGSTT